jgi:formate C-acetyltransferase
VVKRIIDRHGSLNPAEIKNEVYRQLASVTPAPSAGNPRYEEIRHILENSPCFGNDIDDVDLVARQCALIYCQEVEKYTNPRGGRFQAGIYPVSANVLFGKDVSALPDGRLAKEPLADGVSPRQGKDTLGPTAAANSVAKLDHFIASNGTLYNQKFLPSSLAGEKGLRNFGGLVRNYFDKKGMHVQFNVIDRNTLLEAQKNPQQHQDLVVRVAGYSAQFVVLAKEVQDDIISRTEQQF